MLSLYFLLLFSWVGGGGVADFNLKLKSQTGLKTNLRRSRSSLNGFNLERKRDFLKPRLLFSFSHSIFFSRCIKLKEFHLKHKTSWESLLIFQATRNLAFCPPESLHFFYLFVVSLLLAFFWLVSQLLISMQSSFLIVGWQLSEVVVPACR